MNEEKRLEEQYLLFISDHYLLSESKARSIAGYSIKGLVNFPEQFIDLEQSVDSLFEYISRKTSKISRDEVKSYIATRIWREKPLENIQSRTCQMLTLFVRINPILSAQKLISRTITTLKMGTTLVQNNHQNSLILADLLEEVQMLQGVINAEIKYHRAKHRHLAKSIMEVAKGELSHSAVTLDKSLPINDSKIIEGGSNE